MFAVFARHVEEKYRAEAGFITMNLPLLVDALERAGIKNPIVCSNINKIGFRMSGGIDAYRDLIRSRRCRAIAMSVFASGAIPPKEAIEWVCGLEGLHSIVFGASSPRNIRQTKDLIEQAWGSRPAP
jgi:phosphoribosylformimino-5-aminoimidazole carboxamide ribonucleotide (ProFAR) isomerase